MTTPRARTAAGLAAVAVIFLTAAATLYYRYSSSGAHTRAAARITGASTAPVPSLPPEPYPGSADRTRAQAALQACLKQASASAKLSWDGMCTSLAQQNRERREGCQQQGRSAAECQSLYPQTALQDCLLPHATASSIAQSQQSAKGNCYQQFQAEMR